MGKLTPSEVENHIESAYTALTTFRQYIDNMEDGLGYMPMQLKYEPDFVKGLLNGLQNKISEIQVEITVMKTKLGGK